MMQEVTSAEEKEEEEEEPPPLPAPSLPSPSPPHPQDVQSVPPPAATPLTMLLSPTPPPPTPVPPDSPAMEAEEVIVIDDDVQVAPEAPGAGHRFEAGAASWEGPREQPRPPPMEAHLDAMLALQEQLTRGLDVMEGLMVQTVAILQDLRHGQQEIIELLHSMAAAQSLLVMSWAPLGWPPSPRRQ
ncbi:WAS/WASL-interacting protein family member 3-like [Rhinatrema bivittatum]|uniref:WAS/WASL-interacting protein family member 3-like n=1 Tax=Rhinatrema bivittatum TaxID=194408 RepID=UPI001129F1F8|nr:WAS/WASL-interacting protein family member 3-like [Rhinatrema bivittatum]